jgi:hypothetical protein
MRFWLNGGVGLIGAYDLGEESLNIGAVPISRQRCRYFGGKGQAIPNLSIVWSTV